MDKLSVILVLLCCSVGVVRSGAPFLKNVPEVVVAGKSVAIHLNLASVEYPARYKIKLLVYNSVMTTISGHMPPDKKVLTSMKIPKINPTAAVLNLTVVTENRPHFVKMEEKNIAIVDDMIVLLSTNKDIYHPGEKVIIKIVAQIDGKNATVTFPKAWVTNTTNAIVMKYPNIHTKGTRNVTYYLPRTAPLGKWKVTLQLYPNLRLTKSVTFTVLKRVKPNFVVIIVAPSYVLADQTNTKWTICIRREDGSSPQGDLQLTLSTDTGIPGTEVTTQIKLHSPRGCYNFVHKGEISKIGTWNQAPNYVKLTANFTDDESGATESASSITKIHDQALKLKLKQNAAKHFKLGLPYFGTLEVKYPDNKPAPNQNIQLCLIPYREYRPTSDAKECNDVKSDANGNVHFLVPPQPPQTDRLVTTAIATDYPKKIENINDRDVTIMRQPSAKIELDLVSVETDNYVVVSEGDRLIECNKPFAFTVLYTLKKISGSGNEFGYIVYHGNDVVLEDSIKHVATKDSVFNYDMYPNILGSTRHVNVYQTVFKFYLNVTITPRMARSSEIHVYTTQEEQERVSDHITFYVGPCLPNVVKATLIAEDLTPGSSVKYMVQADPGSFCDVSFVEKSDIPQLQSNAIDVDKLYDKIEEKYTPLDEETPKKPECDKSRKETRRNNTNDSEIVWSSQKLNRRRRWVDEDDESCEQVVANAPETPQVQYVSEGLDPDTTIKLFLPKVWFSETLQVGDGGVATLEDHLPDSVTDWKGYTVCASPNGLGIAAPISISAFQSFVLDYDLPHSVKLGETMNVKVKLFNLEPRNIPVTIELGEIPEIEVTSKLKKSFCVKPQGSAEIEYTLAPRTSGTVDVTVNGFIDKESLVDCSESELKPLRDVIVKPLVIMAGGEPIVKTRTSLICPNDASRESSVTWNATLGNDIIPNSERAYMNVIPDLVGLTYENMNKLLPVPKDCGEQNMLLLVTSLLVLKYMDAFAVNNPSIRGKAIANLQDGYQKQFGFKHADGSYSQFVDSESSIWLTAYMMKWLDKFKDYSIVDEEDIRQTTDWIVDKQLDNGCFPLIGTVVRKQMKNDLSENSSPALTAYILISLLESGIPVPEHVINKTVSCLENKMPRGDDLYATILTTYAFALHKHEKVNNLMRRLMSVTVQGNSDTQWWDNENNPSWPLRVEMTCYMVLTLVKLGGEKNLNDALKSVHWILTQRNAYGGFVTTQDTAVCLQALTEFAIVSKIPRMDITVYLNAIDMNEVLPFKEEDRMTSSQVRLPVLPTDIDATVSENGCVIMQLETRYSVNSATNRSNIFDLSVNVYSKRDLNKCKTLNINICIRYKLADSESNMALLEVGLLSGYMADFDSLELLSSSPRVKHFEDNNDVVYVYFDKLTHEQVCVSFEMTRNIVVDNLKPAIVKVSDYYQLGNSAISTYQLPVTCGGTPEVLTKSFFE